MTRTTWFATIPDWLIPLASGSSLKVYAAIDRFADRDGKAFPSRKTLAEKANVSTTAIDRGLKELERLGALTREQRSREDGSLTSSIYHLHREAPDMTRGAHDSVGRGRHESDDPSSIREPEPDRTKGLAAPGPQKVGRRGTTPAERERSAAILRIFNEVFDTKFSADGYLAKIILRLREHPELEIEDHRRVIVENSRAPWWDGPASPSVIYGNDALFERAMLGGSRKRRGLTATEAANLPPEAL